MGQTCKKDDDEDAGGTREELTEAPGLERLVVVERTGSTNDDLRSALTGADGRLDPCAAAAWPHISALWAQYQDAGRGRAGRHWITPPGSALTVSFVLRPLVPAAALAWLPLLAGLAVRDVVDAILIAARVPWRAGTKWPNDVVLVPEGRAGTVGAGTGTSPAPEPIEIPGWGRARKVAGILAEFIPAAEGAGARASTTRVGAAGAVGATGAGAVSADRGAACAVVLGIGVNTGQSASELPVPWATSLRLAGARVEPRALLDPLCARLDELVTAWEAGGGDPDAADGALGVALRRACTSLGRRVRVDAPDGVLRGTAVDIAPGLVLRGADGTVRTVDAGDVSHVRTDGAAD